MLENDQGSSSKKIHDCVTLTRFCQHKRAQMRAFPKTNTTG